MEQLETRRETSSSVTEKLRENLQEAAESIKVRLLIYLNYKNYFYFNPHTFILFQLLSKELRDLKGKIQALKDEKDTYTHELASLLKEKTRLELNIKDLKDEVDGDDSSRKRAQAQLVKLKEEIETKLGELADIKPKYEEQKKREEECTRE